MQCYVPRADGTFSTSLQSTLAHLRAHILEATNKGPPRFAFRQEIPALPFPTESYPSNASHQITVHPSAYMWCGPTHKNWKNNWTMSNLQPPSNLSTSPAPPAADLCQATELMHVTCVLNTYHTCLKCALMHPVISTAPHCESSTTSVWTKPRTRLLRLEMHSAALNPAAQLQRMLNDE